MTQSNRGNGQANEDDSPWFGIDENTVGGWFSGWQSLFGGCEACEGVEWEDFSPGASARNPGHGNLGHNSFEWASFYEIILRAGAAKWYSAYPVDSEHIGDKMLSHADMALTISPQ
jgi:hypothetical protein